MAVPLPAYRSTAPTPIRAIGSLLIAPNGVARRMLSVCRSAFEDISGCISESRRHDAEHDLHLINAERLALRGIQLMQADWAPYTLRMQTILQEIKAAQAADAREDDCVILAWTHAKRLAGCIGRVFVARRSAARATASKGARS